MILLLTVWAFSEYLLRKVSSGLEFNLSKIQSLSDLRSMDYSPKGLEQDFYGNLYLTLSKANVVGKFNSSGKLLGWLGYDHSQGKFVSNWQTIDKSSSEIPEFGFHYPHSIKLHQGNLYITEHFSSQIKKFNLEGEYLGTLGVLENGEISSGFLKDRRFINKGDKNGVFKGIACLAFDQESNLFISDYSSGSILKFNPKGVFIGWVGKRLDGGFNKTWSQLGSPIPSNEFGGFKGLHSISFDSKGLIYVSDTHNHRIVKLDPSGKSIAWLGETIDSQIPTRWLELDLITKASSKLGGFNGPIDLIFDAEDNLFVLEALGNRIQKIWNNGLSGGWIGTKSNGQVASSWYLGDLLPVASSLPGGFNLPYHLIQQGKDFLITDVNNRRIQRISIPHAN